MNLCIWAAARFSDDAMRWPPQGVYWLLWALKVAVTLAWWRHLEVVARRIEHAVLAARARLLKVFLTMLVACWGLTMFGALNLTFVQEPLLVALLVVNMAALVFAGLGLWVIWRLQGALRRRVTAMRI